MTREAALSRLLVKDPPLAQKAVTGGHVVQDKEAMFRSSWVPAPAKPPQPSDFTSAADAAENGESGGAEPAETTASAARRDDLVATDASESRFDAEHARSALSGSLILFGPGSRRRPSILKTQGAWQTSFAK